MPNFYVVATPIGNLGDITIRAIEALKSVDLICAEDTRKTRILLDRFQIKKPIISYHQHSKLQKIDYILDQLKLGKNLALVTDAGTPGISDPGGKLVSEISKLSAEINMIQIIPIPGASGVAAALSVCGFSADKFLFLGFLPRKKGRKTILEKLKVEHGKWEITTVVLYESPYRIIKTLNDLKNSLGDLEVCVCRELTKKFETIYRGTISEILPQIKPKGEFVVVLNLKAKI